MRPRPTRVRSKRRGGTLARTRGDDLIEAPGSPRDRRERPRLRRIHEDAAAAHEVDRHRTTGIDAPLRAVQIGDAQLHASNAVRESANRKRQPERRVFTQSVSRVRPRRADDGIRWVRASGSSSRCASCAVLTRTSLRFLLTLRTLSLEVPGEELQQRAAADRRYLIRQPRPYPTTK